MTRIKSVWFKRGSEWRDGLLTGVAGTFVCEGGAWFTAAFSWSEQNMRWDRVSQYPCRPATWRKKHEPELAE